MRYIETYEYYGSKKQTNKRNKKRQKELKMSVDNVIPGMYVIFNHSRYVFGMRKNINILTFGKVMNMETYVDSEKEGKVANIKIIDFLPEYSFDEGKLSEAYGIGKVLMFYLPIKELLFMNSSAVKTEEEYKRIKETEPYSIWYMNADIEKYNL